MVQEKLTEIEEQIQKLQEKKKQIEQKRNEELNKLMVRIGLADIDNETLAGAFLYIKEQSINNSNESKDTNTKTLIGGWKDTGKSFLQPKRKKQTKQPEQSKQIVNKS